MYMYYMDISLYYASTTQTTCATRQAIGIKVRSPFQLSHDLHDQTNRSPSLSVYLSLSLLISSLL